MTEISKPSNARYWCGLKSGTGVPPVNHAQDARATMREPGPCGGEDLLAHSQSLVWRTAVAVGKKTGFRTVIAAVDDMFFASKIKETAKALGMVVTFPRTLAALVSLAGDELPDLILVDLHNSRLNPIELATQLKSNEILKAVPLLGFFAHVNVDLQRQAVQAGYDEVLPRSLFARDLANILAGGSLDKRS